MLPNHDMMTGFIRNESFNHLSLLNADSPALWGKMNPQQMIEHLVEFVGLSYEKTTFPLCVPEDMVEKYQAFLFSEKMFRENTKAPSQ
jgi:oxepin-CoA hydrolase/3-oxo-5,6-dehydrosuberyl-CoA semialdehyde dehydrogenase